MPLKIDMHLKLPCVITREEKRVVASCPILDVHSQGDSADTAKKNLEEALTCFLISCLERGTLDGVFKQCGFKVAQPSSGDVAYSPETEYLDVPIPFWVNS